MEWSRNARFRKGAKEKKKKSCKSNGSSRRGKEKELMEMIMAIGRLAGKDPESI